VDDRTKRMVPQPSPGVQSGDHLGALYQRQQKVPAGLGELPGLAGPRNTVSESVRRAVRYFIRALRGVRKSASPHLRRWL
jgi:hypothetical protein